MPSIQASKTKSASATSKPKARSSKAARATPQPQSIQRFWGDVFCVVGFPRATEEALGSQLLQEVIAEMNKTCIRFVYQDERCVVNLTTQVVAIKN